MIRQSPFASLCLIVSASTSLAQTPLGTDFSYQGQLSASGLPAVASADFQFSLFDAATGGAQMGATLSRDNVGVVDGLFTTSLDFGPAAFNGEARWLEVAVRSPAGAGAFTTLAPRQALTAAPYALQTRGITVDAANNVGIGTMTPAKKLTVAGDMELGTSSDDYRHMRIGGGNSDGFIYGSYPALGDGIHLGYNYYYDATGDSHSNNAYPGSSRISLGYGEIRLASNGEYAYPPIDGLIVNGDGHVDILQGLTVHKGVYGAKFEFLNGEDIPIFRMSVNGVLQPTFYMISHVTGDNLAGFYRDSESGNGVMFADDKNFRAPNPADPSTDIWYCCPEGPEAAMYVRGTARLTDGHAVIELPDHFRSLSSEPGMTVQLTPLSIESKGLAVVKKSLNGIEVGELGGGTGDYEFDWRVEAVRKGYEDYKVIRPWMHSDPDPDKAWQNRLKHIEERRAHGKPSPVVDATTPRPQE